MEQTLSKRILHIIQAVYYMLRKGLSKKKLTMDLHLLLQRGKLAGKSLTHLLTPHPHTSGSSASAISVFSCLSIDPNLSIHNPTEVEFSCSNTPYAPAFHLLKRGKRSHKHHHDLQKIDAEAIAKAFEILNTTTEAGGDADMAALAALATPSPMLALALGKSPAIVRQLRVTDSPFPIQEEGTPSNGIVDEQADAFIRRFYEQLKLQQSVAATPTPDHGTNRKCGRRGLIR